MKKIIQTWAKASLALLGAVALGLTPALTQAQEYPTKPVRIITPFPVGSGPEGVVRLLADKLSKKWGQSVIEQGSPSGFEVSGWTAIAAPKGLPKAITDKIQRDVAEALNAPDIKEKFVTFGYESFPQTREQFNAYIGTESVRFADIIRKAKAQLD